MSEQKRPFGWELCLDLSSCDSGLLADRDHIEGFLIELCDDVLKMNRYGAPLIERFALDNPEAAGYSAVQLIETSSIVCHFAEQSRTIYLDIFSCREFNADDVIAFCEASFKGTCTGSRLLVRPLEK